MSDLQLERTQQDGDGELWREIDRELEVVLGLCRARSIRAGLDGLERDRETDRDGAESILPPKYDPNDFILADVDDEDSLPQYEAGDRASLSSVKAKGSLEEHAPPRLEAGANGMVDEKMRMDLEAVTLAIDRLYLVAPQLHNQRVELKKSKLEQMERARRVGSGSYSGSASPLTKDKGKAKDLLGMGTEKDVRELNKILELVGKAAERKMVDQAVVLDASFSQRMERARQEDMKRVCFILSRLSSTYVH